MISRTVLVLAEAFAGGLDETRVAEAIALGLQADGRLRCDLCLLDGRADGPFEQTEGRAGAWQRHARARLDGVDFDVRMRAARALVIASERLHDQTLAGSIAFEAATRARQAGVPAYAVTAHDGLDAFEARIIDLQIILEASTRRTLSAAGKKLAAAVLP